jgi:mitochondrial import inner membrane translocase subunit TIM44
MLTRRGPASAILRASANGRFYYGRSPAYRRLISSRWSVRASHNQQRLQLEACARLSSRAAPHSIRPSANGVDVLLAPSTRHFHVGRALAAEGGSRKTGRRSGQEPGAQQDATTAPANAAATAGNATETHTRAENDRSEASSRQEEEAGSRSDGESGESGKEDSSEESKKDESAPPPPPPPHGDKTPWQVFLETMQSEFKQSKEWNESTKALASSAHQFTESESVRKARQAYEATSGAVSSTAANVLKSTAGAIGKGASWTWETPVMKGVRHGANVTGEALDKATKPLRETEAYKNVKDVIDDGSSSRYGGWLEKEERRKKRELRQQLNKLEDGKPHEVFSEDPK